MDGFPSQENMRLSQYWEDLDASPGLKQHAALYDWAGRQFKPGLSLELGCEYGFGCSLLFAANPMLHLIGLDLDLDRLKTASMIFSFERPPMVGADALALPFKTGSITSIAMINLLHLVSDAASLLQECCRVLALGGKAVIALLIDLPAGVDRTQIHFFERLIVKYFPRRFAPHEIEGKPPGFPPERFKLGLDAAFWVMVVWKSMQEGN